MTVPFPVFLLLGQSNMEGRAPNSNALSPEIPANLIGPHENALAWNNVALEFQELEDGVNNKSSNLLDTFGPEMSFTTRMRDLNGGRKVGMLKTASDGSFLANIPGVQDWSLTSLELLGTLFARLFQADTYVTGTGEQLDIRGILWHQGESDAVFGPGGVPDLVTPYKSDLAAVFQAIRDEIVSNGWTTLTHPVPICCAKIHTSWRASLPQPNDEDIDGIRAAFEELAQEEEYIFLTDVDDLPDNGAGDRIHLNGNAQVESGYRFAAQMAQFLAPSYVATRTVDRFDLKVPAVFVETGFRPGPETIPPTSVGVQARARGEFGVRSWSVVFGNSAEEAWLRALTLYETSGYGTLPLDFRPPGETEDVPVTIDVPDAFRSSTPSLYRRSFELTLTEAV